MTSALYRVLIGLVCLSAAASADVIVLHDGASYYGQYKAPGNMVSFTDNQGIHYDVPTADVQSLVFANGVDHLSLRNGKTYTGQLNGANQLEFDGSGGIVYQFPLRDVSSVVLNGSDHPTESRPTVSLVIPSGTQIVVRTADSIKAGGGSNGQVYPAVIVENVFDSAGTVAIPGGAGAKLVIGSYSSGGAVHSPEIYLDLYSVDVHGENYRVDSSGVRESSNTGVGANRRTAEWTGGGAGFGALMGAVFGGGKGAAIGAAAGAGGGLVTQMFVRGKEVSVPAETTLTFRLQRTLVLHP